MGLFSDGLDGQQLTILQRVGQQLHQLHRVRYFGQDVRAQVHDDSFGDIGLKAHQRRHRATARHDLAPALHGIDDGFATDHRFPRVGVPPRHLVHRVVAVAVIDRHPDPQPAEDTQQMVRPVGTRLLHQLVQLVLASGLLFVQLPAGHRAIGRGTSAAVLDVLGSDDRTFVVLQKLAGPRRLQQIDLHLEITTDMKLQRI